MPDILRFAEVLWPIAAALVLVVANWATLRKDAAEAKRAAQDALKAALRARELAEQCATRLTKLEAQHEAVLDSIKEVRDDVRFIRENMLCDPRTAPRRKRPHEQE